MMNSSSDDWETYLDPVLFAINTSCHTTTKASPFLMMFGRQPRFPLETERVGENTEISDVKKQLRPVHDARRAYRELVAVRRR